MNSRGWVFALVVVAVSALFGFGTRAQAATLTVMSESDSGAGSLREAVAVAAEGDTIEFDPGVQAIDLVSGAISIDNGLTIAGAGASQLTIDAGHGSQIFAVTAGDLSISGVTLANGAAPENGGAIYVGGTGSLTVSDCVFTGNSAGEGVVGFNIRGRGGAIYVESTGSLTVSDSTFTANSAGGDGGAADTSNRGHGGAIFIGSSSGPTSVSDSTFISNSAGGLGGAGLESGLGSGGAIWDGGEESLVVSGSTFTANTVGGDGGVGVQSGNGAGAAIQKAGGHSLSVSDSEFTANTAGGDGNGERSGQGLGGAVYVSQPSPSATSLSVIDSSFSANTAGGAGGDGPASGFGEGGAISDRGDGALSVSGTTFEGNSAGGSGGDGGSVIGALGSGGGRGGAVLVARPGLLVPGSGAPASFVGAVFSANTAGGDGGEGFLSGRGEGGAIAVLDGISLTVTGTEFVASVAGGARGAGAGAGAANGGALYSIGDLTVSTSTFTDNAAGGQGGSGEGAFGFGGAIHNFNNVSPMTVTGSTFAGNTAGGRGGTGNGGAISVSSVSARSASITNSTLVGNAAGGGGAIGRGGGIEVDGNVSATLASVTIDENEVGAGGSGAGIEGAGAVTARATIVSDNGGAANCDAPAASTSYSLEGPSAADTSCGFDLPSADPLLGALAENGGPTQTQALPASSPAVDAVPAGNCPTSVDQRGESRPDNGKSVCDVGAFELQDPPVPPSIISAAAATFQVGRAGIVTVTSTGLPVPDLSLDGALPGGVNFADNGDGSAILSGTPAPGTGGAYPLAIRASNGITPDAEQSFTLTVQAPPSDPSPPQIPDPSPPQIPGPPKQPPWPKLPPPLKGRTLISYSQEGGIGGPRPSLVVFENRRARVTLGRCRAKLVLRSSAWRRLRATLRRAHLRALAGDYPAPGGSADLITHMIRSRAGTVRIALPQPERREVVRSLRPLLGVLEGLVSAGKRRMPSSCEQKR